MKLMRRVAWTGIFLISLSAQAPASSLIVDGLTGAGSAGAETVTDGESLWNLTGGAANFTAAAYTSTYDTKNEILQYYVVANGSNGSSVFSLGELNGSGFGTSAVNISITGNQISVVDPSAPARSVTNLTSLQILSVPALPNGAGGQSGNVAVSGGGNPGTYTNSQLQSFASGHGGAVQVTPAGSPTYTGISLSTFLGLSTLPTSVVLNDIVITQGTDGYEVVLAAAELDPALGGNPNDILAYASTGMDFPNDGVARTIFPTDSKHGRWMSNLDVIEVVPATPLPAALPLFATGLGALALLGWRRKRTAPSVAA